MRKKGKHHRGKGKGRKKRNWQLIQEVKKIERQIAKHRAYFNKEVEAMR